MEYNDNYIKIEIMDSTPVITMEYDGLESFKDLIFFILSPAGLELFYNTIEKDLILNNKKDELKVLTSIVKLISEKNNLINNTIDEDEFISPSFFK
jgi:hypothetical protein